MTVFVAHAPADREAAESLEKYVERRGQFVELDDGQEARRPVGSADVVVLLSSERLLAAPERARLEQRALDAWAEGRLLLVRLDDAAPAVGFRDLPALGRSDGGDWAAVVEALQALLAKPPASAGGSERGETGKLALLGLAGVAAVGLAAGWVVAAIWLADRIGPVPGGWPELREGLDAFGRRFGVPFGSWVMLGAAVAGAAAALALLVRGATALARSLTAAVRRARRQAVLLCAAADLDAVAPLLRAAPGMRIQTTRGDEAHPLRLAEAMRAASRCVAACSPNAYGDDGLKRALYMADRGGLPLAAVYLTPDAPPPDFVHFLAGARGMKLYETPQSDAEQAMLDVLGADS